MDCYGSYGRKRKAECANCSKVRWCREASDVELLRDHMMSFAEELQDSEAREMAEEQAGRGNRNSTAKSWNIRAMICWK